MGPTVRSLVTGGEGGGCCTAGVVGREEGEGPGCCRSLQVGGDRIFEISRAGDEAGEKERCCCEGKTASADMEEGLGSCCPTAEEKRREESAAVGNSSPERDAALPLCVAVVREDGWSVDVFDAAGTSVTFATDGKKTFSSPGGVGGAEEGPGICFSTHGYADGRHDGLLTPCFNGDGLHGEPDEGCFCGVDTPHIHAHRYDEGRCAPKEPGQSEEGGCRKAEEAKKREREASGEKDLGFLAQLTLHPIETKDGEDGTTAAGGPDDQNGGRSSVGGRKMPITNRLPKECNSKIVNKTLRVHGLEKELERDHDIDESGGGGIERKKTSGGRGLSEVRRRRMYKVQHEDHYDYLVHNSKTGDLHLEHPCESCGSNDYHGRLRLIGKRRLTNLDSDAFSDETVPDSFKKLDLHFFEAGDGSGRGGGYSRPFHVFDLLGDLLSVNTPGRVAAIREMPCCARTAAGEECDCPPSPPPWGVRFSLTPDRARGRSRGEEAVALVAESDEKDRFEGGVRTKEEETAPLSEASTSCCINGVCTKLRDGRDEDAASSISTTPTETTAGSSVRSHFHVGNICCASEIPAIRKIVTPMEGVKGLSVNPTIKTVYVDHDPSVTSASDVKAALDREGFPASIKRDGGGAELGSVRSHFRVGNLCCASEIPAIRKIVSSLDGMKGLTVNPTVKAVYVDHDPSMLTAADLKAALDREGFPATIKKDGGAVAAVSSNRGGGVLGFAAAASTTFVSSEFGITFPEGENMDGSRLGASLSRHGQDLVRYHSFSSASNLLTVEHNPLYLTANMLKAGLDTDGIRASILTDGAGDGAWAMPKLEESETIDAHVSRVNPFVVLSGVFWVVSMLSYIGGNWEYLEYVGLLSVVFGLPPIARKAFRTLRRHQFDANCLMLFAAVGAVALQDYPEAAAVTFLFAISEFLETRATARARNALSAIVSLRPDSAKLVNPATGELVLVPASAVSVGATVAVRSGDKIPCDGVVVEGRSTVDESSLTGESRPVKKGPGDAVSGGTINSGATRLMVETTATVENSAVARLIRLVEEAQANRSPTEKMVDEFAKRYTPMVVLAAISMCTIPWIFGRDVGREWTKLGLITIVIACPCALIISTPVTYVAGLAAMAQKGVVVKGGAHLEALGKVRKIAFDKTGTLTEGVFALLHLNVIADRVTRKELLEYISVMEAPSSHPLADALVAAAKKEGVDMPKHLVVQNHTFLAGEGVNAVVNGCVVHVGNVRLFDRLGLYAELLDADKLLAQRWASDGGTVGFISIEGKGIVGAYSVADAVRNESRAVLANLKRLGVDSYVLTGDGETAAFAIGNQVGLPPEFIQSQLKPEDKLDLVRKMKVDSNAAAATSSSPLKLFKPKRGLVLMCGDGVNDAPALATADVGVAMGAGAALAMETSDVTLMDSNLNKLLLSLEMGRRVSRTIKENISFSLVAKAVVMGFTFAGMATLWLAIASDVGAMLIVTFNGMKLLPSSKKVSSMTSTLQQPKPSDIEDLTTTGHSA